MMTPFWTVATLWVGLLAAPDEVLVAVAANFASTAESLAERFGHDGACVVRITSASTGTLYAQIRNGAPFDVLMAADTLRPALLETEGWAVRGSRFTYAVGRLALWAPGTNDPVAFLRGGEYRHLAVATPSTAPYGAAAYQVLERLSLLDAISSRMARGQNVIQAYQFVASGNAELGFVSLAQVMDAPQREVWVVDADLYEPIHQQAVLLRRVPAHPCASAFVAFLRTAPATAIIEGRGYIVEAR